MGNAAASDKDRLFSELVSDQFEIIQRDPYLKPFANFFHDMRQRASSTEKRLTLGRMSLKEFATAHYYYGLHFEEGQWVFREWAPNASAIYLVGAFSDWQKREDFACQKIPGGSWELTVPAHVLSHGDLYHLYIEWPGGAGDRLPSFVRRAVQDDRTKIFNAQVWQPEEGHYWRSKFEPHFEEPLLIYEAHIGMAQQEEKVGSYREFKDKILPRIVGAGYNTLQLMAIQEHPYYGSFGYQVSNFFAPSSRFGTPEELKDLIDTAHEAGLAVLLDLIHSHAVKNEVEGLSRFDGTYYQYFHQGERGEHPIWDSRLFNYAKTEVLQFLLSNVRYWIEEFRFDGFRFDGVTSMLYLDHGLGDPFTSYDKYFCHNLDRDALTYLSLANKLAHECGTVATIAEDVSGLPGLAASLESGGFGFDYRLAMGVPDLWTKLLKTQQDNQWHVERIFWELTNRRADEKTISYAESHDQALVGDQTIIFRLLETLIYDCMRVDQSNHLVDRGMALHRMIRFSTVTTAGHGYLNFMGNEFGHPEWIDFPRPGNNWSYHYARRLWYLRDNSELQYHKLADFDAAMIALVKEHRVLQDPWAHGLYFHIDHQVVCFRRAGLLFFFSFNPENSFPDYSIPAPEGTYELIFDSDTVGFGGNGRLSIGHHFYSVPVQREDGSLCHEMKVYLPTRTAFVLRMVSR